MGKKTVEQVLKSELPRYGLKYEDNSDEDVSRLSIVKPEWNFVKMFVGMKQNSIEIARITGLENDVEVMLFEKSMEDEIEAVLKTVKRETGRHYKIIKCY